MSTLRQEGTPGLTEVCCRMHLEVADEAELGYVHPGRLTFLANGDIGQVFWKFQFLCHRCGDEQIS